MAEIICSFAYVVWYQFSVLCKTISINQHLSAPQKCTLQNIIAFHMLILASSVAAVTCQLLIVLLLTMYIYIHYIYIYIAAYLGNCGKDQRNRTATTLDSARLFHPFKSLWVAPWESQHSHRHHFTNTGALPHNTGAADPSAQAWYAYDKHKEFQSGFLNTKFLVEQKCHDAQGVSGATPNPHSVPHHHADTKLADHRSWHSYCKLLQIRHVRNPYLIQHGRTNRKEMVNECEKNSLIPYFLKLWNSLGIL